MNQHTDSVIVEYNEDGSRTETSTITYQPVTTTQKAFAYTGLVLLCVSPVIPLLTVLGLEKAEEKLAARKEKKRLKSVK